MLEGTSMEGLRCCCYGVPAHICPTAASHDHACVVQEGKAVGLWDIAARRRSLGFKSCGFWMRIWISP